VTTISSFVYGEVKLSRNILSYLGVTLLSSGPRHNHCRRRNTEVPRQLADGEWGRCAFVARWAHGAIIQEMSSILTMGEPKEDPQKVCTTVQTRTRLTAFRLLILLFDQATHSNSKFKCSSCKVHRRKGKQHEGSSFIALVHTSHIRRQPATSL
jgi:hypothetical protein